MSFVDLGPHNLWVAAHAKTSPALRQRIVPVWRLLNPTPAAVHLGHANELKAVRPAAMKPALTRSMRAALLETRLATRDVVILQFGNAEPDRSRCGLLAGLAPALASKAAVSTTLRLDDFLLEISLKRNRMLHVQPWVFDHADSSMYEGDVAAMDITWFGLMREGIDRVAVDVARLLPHGWPDFPGTEALAAWLGTIFVEEVNPSLPQPFRLHKAPSEISQGEIAIARDAVADILAVDPDAAAAPSCAVHFTLPNGPFGIARFDRHAAGVPHGAADRLAVLIGMAIEDIEGSPVNIDQAHHADLMPRRLGDYAGGVQVKRGKPDSAHAAIEAHARVARLYKAKRNAWLARWRLVAPDGLPVPASAIAELDALLLGGGSQQAA